MHVPDFRALFESSPGLYLALLPNAPLFTIVAVSDAYARATMTHRHEILGRGLFEVFPDNPDDPGADGVRNLRDSLLRVIATRSADAMAVQKYDVRRPAEQGGGFEERWWSPMNSPALAADGSLVYILHRVEDVTDFVRLKQQGVERERLTDELRSRAESMEAEIFLRARQLQQSNEQLRQANAEVSRLYEKTLELDRLKTQFFANVSHELRTPLTLILGPAQRLLAGAKDAEERRHLDVIERNARTLLRHVNDLLDAASLDANGMAPRHARTDLASLIRAVAEHFDSVAHELDIRWTVEAPPSLPIETDPEMVKRVLLNLLSNAFKFTPAGGRVRLLLSALPDKIVLEVGDSGPGIAPDLRAAAFERFRQLEGSSRRRHGGTGLGLAIAREFVLLLDGCIEVRDAPEGGALFVVELPLRVPDSADVKGRQVDPRVVNDTAAHVEALLHHPEPAQEPAPCTSQEPLVLVVEDNRDMSGYIRQSLAPRYRVAASYDGARGLEEARARRPDLVLTDLMMPDMSGDELVHALRADASFDDMPVVVLTARADDAQRGQLFRQGADDYLIKPFSVEELRARVDRLISHRQAVKALRHHESSWRALFAHASDAILIADSAGRYVEANDAACALLHRRRDQIVGRPVAEMLPTKEVTRLGDPLDEARRGDTQVREWMMSLGDGGQVAVEVSDCILSDGRWIAFVRDATERRRAQRAARRFAREMERRVEERTAALRRLSGELEAVESRERRQLARDLHDDLGQTLAAVHIRLAGLCQDPRADVREACTEIARLVDDAHRATRSLAAQLAPAVLYELGLKPALEWLADDLGRSFGLAISVQDDGSDKPLSQEVRSIVYRAVRELLINVAKHAKVDRASVKILRKGDNMLIRVSDAGVGYDRKAHGYALSSGVGLHSVRERLAFIGGGFDIRSIPGDGTEARLSVPLALQGETCQGA